MYYGFATGGGVCKAGVTLSAWLLFATIRNSRRQANWLGGVVFFSEIRRRKVYFPVIRW